MKKIIVWMTLIGIMSLISINKTSANVDGYDLRIDPSKNLSSFLDVVKTEDGFIALGLHGELKEEDGWLTLNNYLAYYDEEFNLLSKKDLEITNYNFYYHKLVKTEDALFVINNSFDILEIKDGTGEEVLHDLYPEATGEITKLLPIDGGGYILIGNKYIDGYKAIIVSLNEDFEIMWERTYNSFIGSKYLDIIGLNHSYIVTGYEEKCQERDVFPCHVETRGLITQYSLDGDVIDQKLLSPDLMVINHIIKTSQDKFIVTGFSNKMTCYKAFSAFIGEYHPLTGDITYKSYGKVNNDFIFNSIFENENHELVVSGTYALDHFVSLTETTNDFYEKYYSFEFPVRSGFVTKFDQNFNVVMESKLELASFNQMLPYNETYLVIGDLIDEDHFFKHYNNENQKGGVFVSKDAFIGTIDENHIPKFKINMEFTESLENEDPKEKSFNYLYLIIPVFIVIPISIYGIIKFKKR